MKTFLGLVIIAGWLITLTRGTITGDWSGLTHVTPIMAIFASYMFGDNILKRRYPKREE